MRDKSLAQVYDIALLRKRFSSLYYSHAGGWRLIPDWARFYLEFGSIFPTLVKENQFSVAVLSVPIRSYAAALIAFGMVTVNAITNEQGTDEEYLRYIQSLPPETPIIWRNKGRKLKAYYLRCIPHQGRTLIWLRTEQGTERGEPIENVRTIEVLEQRTTISLPKHQKGRLIQPISPLLQILPDQQAINNFVLKSQLTCLIVGSLSSLENEIQQSQLAFETERGVFYEGTLQDILRVQDFLPYGTAYRTRIVPARANSSSDLPDKLPPNVIFDNAIGFLKQRDKLRKLNWIVILDRTDKNFEHALTEVNQEYTQNRLDARKPADIPSPPSGVELMIYQVSV